MRKVTQDIKEAFEQRKAKTIGNTSTDGESVWLHGNKIVTRDKSGMVIATLAGWNTPTTRERVNGITGMNFHQVNFEARLNGHEIDPFAWFVKTDEVNTTAQVVL
tara:strand:- start:89 stop:403 length:315 start_codon:yes stop_codon:yes gene_type:complete